MCNHDDFVVENGVLKKYVGSGGNVEIPDSVTSIGNKAFYNCNTITNIIIPERVSSIGDEAFMWCRNLTEVVIHEGLKSIGNSVFEYCTSLISVSIPQSIESVGKYTFESCKSLKTVNIGSLEAWLRITFQGPHFRELNSGCYQIYIHEVLLTSMSIPKGVTTIGKWAFEGWRDLKSVVIPEGVKIIEQGAFKNCSRLESVVLPESLTDIDSEAFCNCSSLSDIRIPEGVTYIGSRAFAYCSNLSSVVVPEKITRINDSTFLDCSRLVSVEIPSGITSICDQAFDGCKSLTDFVLPGKIESIGAWAFSGCESLVDIKIPKSTKKINTKAFFGCKKLTTVLFDPSSQVSLYSCVFEDCRNLQIVVSPERMYYDQAPGCSFGQCVLGKTEQYLAFAANKQHDNLSEFLKLNKWDSYDNELVNNGPIFNYKIYARLVGAIGRLLNPVELKDEFRKAYLVLLQENLKKLIPILESLKLPEAVEMLFKEGVINENNQKAIRKLLAASSVPEIASLQDFELRGKKEQLEPKVITGNTELVIEFEDKYEKLGGNKVLRELKLFNTKIPVVQMLDGREAPEALLKFVLISYGRQIKTHEPKILKEADAAAALLRYDSLLEALNFQGSNLDATNYPAIIPVICRYGSAATIRMFLQKYKNWGIWGAFGAKGRSAQKLLVKMLCLSDTHEAVLWLDKNADLEEYARIRGVKVADVYDQYLFDFGFDENGKKIYNLGTTTIEVSLGQDLKLSLFDTTSKKIVRTLPKKGIDPAVQKIAADDVADLRANIKKAVRLKTDQLFDDYIIGRYTTVEAWKKSYLNNYLLHEVARLLVWEQNGRFFTLGDSGTVDSEGKLFTFEEREIRLAHPMEMPENEVAAWQQFYASRGLKQLFSQVWEPVYDPKKIHDDRYRDCPINIFYLKNQEKRGIYVEWWENYYAQSKRFQIDGFTTLVEQHYEDGSYGQLDKLKLEIVSIHPLNWNRRTNMVISYLDRVTVYGRIKKDDVEIINQIQNFTLAQIVDLIKVAQESNAVNVLSLLMNMRKNNFEGIDPMDEFALEW